jgi:hypothetical protein
MSSRYSAAEDEYIRENYTANTYFEIGLAINRDPRSVRERALNLGLKKNERRNWSSDECLLFLAHMTLPDSQLATMLGRKKESVAAKRVWFRRRIKVVNDELRAEHL